MLVATKFPKETVLSAINLIISEALSMNCGSFGNGVAIAMSFVLFLWTRLSIFQTFLVFHPWY